MSVLGEIIATKKTDVAGRIQRRPIEAVRESAVATDRSLEKSIRRPGLRFILECKKSSPSEGTLRSSFDPAAIADIYKNFADGVSVLTDARYFGGDLSHLRLVRQRVNVPVLCKDFIVDPYQVVEARVAGADAVLLMMSVLDDDGYRRCAAEASRWMMDVLCEVHDEAELSRAIALGASVIGINNRDLRTLAVDTAVTLRLARKVPPDRIVISESGIRTRADVDSLRVSARAFLVGSQLMKADRLDLAVRRLIFGEVKICGLMSPEQVRAAYEAGATYGGLVFAAESPRCVTPDQALRIAQDSPLPLVGVFVNESIERVVRLASELRLFAVQLHGEESERYIYDLRRQLVYSCLIWKAVRVERSLPDMDLGNVQRFVLDARRDGRRGGTGTSFDWSILNKLAYKQPLILSGGIRPENVCTAHDVGCGALDISSGVESSPGVKDASKLRRLFAALRGE